MAGEGLTEVAAGWKEWGIPPVSHKVYVFVLFVRSESEWVPWVPGMLKRRVWTVRFGTFRFHPSSMVAKAALKKLPYFPRLRRAPWEVKFVP